MRGAIRRRGDRWEFAVRVDTSDIDNRQLKRAGFVLRKDAQSGLDHVRELVKLAGADDRLRRRIGDVIFKARYGRPLPSVDEVRRRLGAGREPDVQAYTVAEWLDIWLAERGHLDAATQGSYRIHVEKHLKPHLGDVQLDRLDGRHIRAMFAAIDARNDVIRMAKATGRRAPDDPRDRRRHANVTGLNTQRQILKTVRAALYAAMGEDHRLLDHNAAARFRLARDVEKPRVWWSAEEASRFLEGTRDDRLFALWRVALMGGLRLGELLQLCWADVDLDAKTLNVRHGKTRSSRRTIVLDDGTVDALKAHRKRQLEERLATYGAYHENENDLVFRREDGAAIQPHRPRIEFKRLARRHGLPVIRFHDARHSNASMLLEAGIDIKVVSERLGHSSTRITSDVYTHVIRELQVDAVDRLAALVDGRN